MFTLLKGLKIIDLTTVVLGPYATQFLADLGADVIKIESLEGDVFRSVRPGRREDLGVAFMNYNRNKRGMCIDLKSPAGQQLLHRLVAGADVVVHNMRARSAAQLGADYEALAAVKPGLVYCYSPGFGQLGEDRDAPAYDDIIQARSGLASLNADEKGAPQFVRTIACDKVVGLHLAIAIQAGVIQQLRTGEGVCIEVPMLETMTAFLLSEHLHGHTLIPEEGELGYDRLMTKNRRPYRTLDGYLAILPYSTRHWIRFFQVCEAPDWATADMVIDASLRSQNIDVLYGKIAELAATRTTADWLRLLREQDIPCSVVSSLADLMVDPHLLGARMYHELTDTRVGKVREVRSPFQIDGALDHDVEESNIAPGLGEHTRELLSELGLSEDDISALQTNKVVA